jgi:sulfate permease, SulP family
VFIYRLDAPLIFANVDIILDDINIKLGMLASPPRVFILDCESIGEIDTTGMDALLRLRDTLAKQNATLALARVHAAVQRSILDDGSLAEGLAGVYPTVSAAVDASASADTS